MSTVKNTGLSFVVLAILVSQVEMASAEVAQGRVVEQPMVKTAVAKPAPKRAQKNEKKPKKKKEKKPKQEKQPKKGKAEKKAEPKITIDVDYNKQMMDEVYQDITGFGTLKPCEENKIVDGGGAPTYGEITYDSLQQLIDDLALTPADVFVDLGSGVGKVTLQMALNTPIKKAVGIELADTRYEGALKALKRFIEKGLLKKGRVEFRNENMLETNIKDATVVYTCSTCFSPELMRGIAEMLSKLKSGLRFLTLKQIPSPEKYGFVLIKEYNLPMTWAAGGNAVYFYELQK